MSLDLVHLSKSWTRHLMHYGPGSAALYHCNKHDWKFNIRASLSQQKLDIISDMMEENTRFLLNEWNFIQVSVSSHFSFTFEFRIACVNISDLFLPKDYLDYDVVL